MRLIDADEYKGKVICNHLYSGVTRLIDVNSVPTAFDLESVIEQIKDEERRLLVEMELFGNTQGVSLELVFIKYNQALVELVKVREILKSALTATNGKNGEEVARNPVGTLLEVKQKTYPSKAVDVRKVNAEYFPLPKINKGSD